MICSSNGFELVGIISRKSGISSSCSTAMPSPSSITVKTHLSSTATGNSLVMYLCDAHFAICTSVPFSTTTEKEKTSLSYYLSILIHLKYETALFHNLITSWYNYSIRISVASLWSHLSILIHFGQHDNHSWSHIPDHLPENRDGFGCGTCRWTHFLSLLQYHNIQHIIQCTS